MCSTNAREVLGVALDLDPHPVGLVPDPPREGPLRGGAVDEWPETDALHDAAHADNKSAARGLGYRHFIRGG